MTSPSDSPHFPSSHATSRSEIDYQNAIAEAVRRTKPENGVEVGFCYGYSALAFLENSPGKLISIDMRNYPDTHKRIKDAGHGDRLELVMGDSSEKLRELRGQEFDWIYIDGDHTYEGAKKDILAALPLLSDRGVIVMDDYFAGDDEFGVYGVIQAVDEIFDGKDWVRVYEDIPFNNCAVAFKRASTSSSGGEKPKRRTASDSGS